MGSHFKSRAKHCIPLIAGLNLARPGGLARRGLLIDWFLHAHQLGVFAGVGGMCVVGSEGGRWGGGGK